jgi:LacI family transcriptional regulator
MSTIRDVARLAGVGVATASRALSGNGSVAPATVDKVRAAAQQLDFRPSSIARALTLRRSGAIGVFVPSFDAAFYAAILRSADDVLRGAGHHMIVANGCGTGGPRQQALEGIDFLHGRNCDALLVASHSLSDEDCEELLRRQPRTAIVNRLVPGHAARCFSVDHEAAGRLAARTLLSQGHRQVALISGPAHAPDNEARLRGFTGELAQHGLHVRPEHRDSGLFDFHSGDAAMRRLLPALIGAHAGVPRATALFVANDLMAMAAISALVASGLRVPQDLSVLGYDDSVFAGYTAPPLTTVHVPIEEVSAEACRLLLNECYELQLGVQHEHPPTLVWRDSVAPGPHLPLGLRPASPPVTAPPATASSS